MIPAERQDNQNVVKLKNLREPEWRRLVDAVYRDWGGTDLQFIYEALQLQPGQQEAEALAARSNMVRVVPRSTIRPASSCAGLSVPWRTASCAWWISHRCAVLRDSR